MALGRLIKNTVRKFVKWSLSDEANKYREDVPMAIGSGSLKSNSTRSIGDGSNGMNFVVYHATGGKVVQFSTYNPATDRSKTELYVITDKENLGEELGLIITKESLTR